MTMWSWLRPVYPVAADVEAVWAHAMTRLPYAAALSSADQIRLRALVRWFLREKTFEGAAGLEITDQMRVEVALQACILILNLDRDYYSGWHAVILYPGDFVVSKEMMDEDGVVHQWTEEIAGESWEQGPVILSWDATATPDSDMNIVIHEFAHKLDMRDGIANGCPPLRTSQPVNDWARDFSQAYEGFCKDLIAGRSTRIDDYASESPAEFFAVLSELFFINPRVVAEDFTALYRHLVAFYGQYPLTLISTP